MAAQGNVIAGGTQMPQKMWKHECPETRGSFLMGTPVCRNCGRPGEFDGWHFGMHEAMAQYQSLYGLKPIGPHRKMADKLFNGVTVTCHACGGQGLRNLKGGERWEICSLCKGLGIFFAGPLTDLIEIRRRVLDVFDDASAAPVPHFATQPVAHDLSQGTIVNVATGGVSTGATKEEDDNG